MLGEEVGLPEAGLPFEALRDPYGIAFWPNFKGRDGCRTPMPWRDTPDGGFSTGTPWLPVPRSTSQSPGASWSFPGTAPLSAMLQENNAPDLGEAGALP